MAATEIIERQEAPAVGGGPTEGAPRPGSNRGWAHRLGHRLTDRPGLAVAGLAAVAAGWAVAASTWLFPHLTVDVDEPVYLLQADTIRHGHLFPPAPAIHGNALLPWLSTQVGHHYVPKYAPVWPAVIAAAHLVTGTDRTALAVVAAATIVMTFLLGREVLGSSRRALAAAAFLLLSPLFLMQSASYLSYVPALLLLETFATALLAGVRRRSRPLLVVAGLFAGLALFARPFDAVLVTLPFVAWFVVEHRRSIRRLFADGAWVVVGAIPPGVAMLAFFRAATGSPFRSPFTLTDKSDTLGFGVHKVFAGDRGFQYGPEQAWHGLLGHSLLLSFWSFGGLVLFGLAIIAVWRRSTRRERFLGLVALSIPLGYVFFWGSWLLTQLEGPWRVGPFYYLPVLAPLVILGGKGFARVWTWDRKLAALALVCMAGVSGFVLVRAATEQTRRTAADRPLHTPLERARLDHALVFVPSLGTDRLLSPFIEARNPTLNGRVVWALDHGADNVDLLGEFPGRTPYVLTAQTGTRPALSRMVLQRGADVPVDLTITRGRLRSPFALRVSFSGRIDTFVLGTDPVTHLTLHLMVGETTATAVSGSISDHTSTVAPSGDDGPYVALVHPNATDDSDTFGWVGLQGRAEGGEVRALVPVEPIRDGPVVVRAAAA